MSDKKQVSIELSDEQLGEIVGGTTKQTTISKETVERVSATKNMDEHSETKKSWLFEGCYK